MMCAVCCVLCTMHMQRKTRENIALHSKAAAILEDCSDQAVDVAVGDEGESESGSERDEKSRRGVGR